MSSSVEAGEKFMNVIFLITQHKIFIVFEQCLEIKSYFSPIKLLMYVNAEAKNSWT